MKKNYFKNLMQVSLLLGAAFVISSCDDVIGQEDNPVASYVQWDAKTPKSIELTLGIPTKSTATVKAVAVSSVVIVYESENPEIAKVDPVTGVITAVGVGETNVKAVVTGASSAGQSVFIPTEIKIPVVVKDGKAKLTLVKEEVIEYTANKDSIIDLSKLFSAYPEIGAGDNKSSISYAAYTYDYAGTTATPKKYNKNTNYNDELGTITGNEFKIGGTLGLAIDPKDFTDTLYVEATIAKATTTNEYNYTDADALKATVKIVLKKSIAYLNEKNERTILTADKYTTFTDAVAATGYDGTLKAGTYFADKWLNTSTPKISGDVSIIIPNDYSWNYYSIDDAKDGSTLNFFRQANVKDNNGDDLPVGIMRFRGATNVITNFKAINLYGGTIEFNNTIAGVGEINVYNDAKLTTYQSDYGYYNSGKIQLKDGGKLTVAGGTVDIIGWGTDLNTGFAVIGDVEVSKGVFTASNSDYRAVKGNLTAGGKILIKESNDKSTWTALEGAKSTSKYIKAQETSKTWK